MSDLQRYDLIDTGSPFQPWREMEEADDGQWMEAEEVGKRIATQAAEIERLKAQRDALLEAADALIRFLGEEGYAADDRGLPDPYDEIEAMVRCIAQARGQEGE